MYKAKLWDEDKWNIHSSSYNSSKYADTAGNDKKDDKKYHEQKYGTMDKNPGSDYMRKEEHKEKEENKKEIFDDSEEEKKDNAIKDEEIPFRAAKQLFNEKKFAEHKIAQKKDVATIEDAIKKAIEEEKKVIIMDN